jgi:large subunit ribosomal protein L25
MKLEISQRTAGKKSETNRLRREGFIPAIIYVQGKPAVDITIKNSDYQGLMRQVLPGRLSTTVFSLVDSKGKTHKALIKEIQYHPTTYNVLHLDFIELQDKEKVNVKVPIECTGIADCVGIKLGGALRQVIRYLLVRCLPKDIPSVLELDIRNLGPRESRKLSDLAIPETVQPLMDLHEVMAVIVKR